MGSRIIEIHSEVLSHVILLVKEVGSVATGRVELEDRECLIYCACYTQQSSWHLVGIQ